MRHSHQILVVEDNEEIRESLVEFLQDHGCDAVGARNGRDALDQLTCADARPCLIVLDLMMPIMDGREFRELQLQNPELSTIPVVVISAYRDGEERSKDLNVAAHLRKPLDLTELMQALQQHCLPHELPA